MSTNIVLGVDNLNGHLPALGMLSRLKFSDPQLTLIHVASEHLPFKPAFEDMEKLEEEYAKVATNLGHIALRETTAVACSKELPCEATLVHGNPAECLIREAETHRADLIAVNTKRHGVARSSYISSVGRALAIGSRTSVLLTKGEQGKRGVFRAVFATDHSPFAQRCLQRFLELAPKGIEEVHVVSAWELSDNESAILGQNLMHLGGDADRWVEEAVEERTAEVCAKLEAAGYRTRSIVRRGRPNEVIHQAMAEVRADLLVAGSQGTGAMERALVGSVSLHQATAEFYPVLIIRPREVIA